MTDDRQRRQIASLVRRARKARDLTQRDLAEKAAVAPGTVNSIENGRSVRPGSLRSVVEVLGLPSLEEAPAESSDMQLALDMVRQWILAISEEERQAAIHALTRFTVLGEWRDR